MATCTVALCQNLVLRFGESQFLKGVFAKNERGYRLNAKNKRFWSPLILLLSVASIRRKLLKTTYTEERSIHTNSFFANTPFKIHSFLTFFLTHDPFFSQLMIPCFSALIPFFSNSDPFYLSSRFLLPPLMIPSINKVTTPLSWKPQPTYISCYRSV